MAPSKNLIGALAARAPWTHWGYFILIQAESIPPYEPPPTITARSFKPYESLISFIRSVKSFIAYSTVRYFRFSLSNVFSPKGIDSPKYLCSAHTVTAPNYLARVSLMNPEFS